MFLLPDLPYDYSALEPYIDEKTMHVHHDKHHATYVKNLNDVLKDEHSLLAKSVETLLVELQKIPEAIRTKVRNNGGGHANHTMFWEMMEPNPKGTKRLPEGDIRKAIDEAFGNFEGFQDKFSAAALNRFGSGWAWLVVNKGKLEVADTANQDSPLSEGKTPVLTLDVWEHAYYLKYQNLRADYIKAWWNIVNWGEVARRFAQAVQ